MNTLADLRTRAAQALHQQSSAVREDWLHQASPWLERTASAIDAVSQYSVDSTRQPAISLDVFDATGTGLWARGRTAKHLPKTSEDSAQSPRQPRARDEPRANKRQRGKVRTANREDQARNDARGRNDVHVWGVADAARALRRGDVSPLELLDASIAQIEATEHEVKAWECVTMDAARTAAQQLLRATSDDAPEQRLFGIPFGAKDNVFTKGVPTTGSSALYRDFVPTRNADIIDTLHQQSAILLGKTTATEMALGDPPPTRNPWNLGHTPGGSSAGSAAAVAANHVPFAIASQTGGSINRPASYCGLVAVKPTWGRISRGGVLPLAWTLDHMGVMTRSVEDQAWVFDVLAGTDYRELADHASSGRRTSELPKKLRIGRPDRYFFGTVLHSAQHHAFEAMLEELRGCGMRIVDIELPPSFEVAVSAHTLIMQCEVAAAYGLRGAEALQLLRPTLRSRILAGLVTPAPMYLRAQHIRRAYIEQMDALFEHVDVLATPSTPTPADQGIEYSGSAAFNSPFSMAGFPTIVFPTGLDEHTGCPLSAQLIARPNDESSLFEAAFAYEHSTQGLALSNMYAD